jgi:hypothetical protein
MKNQTSISESLKRFDEKFYEGSDCRLMCSEHDSPVSRAEIINFLRQELLALVESCPSEKIADKANEQYWKNVYPPDSKWADGYNDKCRIDCDLIEAWKSGVKK